MASPKHKKLPEQETTIPDQETIPNQETAIPPEKSEDKKEETTSFESVGTEPNEVEEKLSENDKAEYLYNIPITETPEFAAYVVNNTLHLIGYAKTDLGIVSIDSETQLQGENTPGPVTFAGEVPEPINNALSSCMQDASMKIRREKIVLAAKGLISRARDGDQVAVDILASTRDQALKGNPHAKFSFDILNELVKEDFTSIGHEELTKAAYTGNKEIYSLAVAKHLPIEVMILVNGPAITSKLLASITKAFSDSEQRLFAFGIEHHEDTIEERKSRPVSIVNCGKAVERARRIQFLRLPDTTINSVYPNVGWELGE